MCKSVAEGGQRCNGHRLADNNSKARTAQRRMMTAKEKGDVEAYEVQSNRLNAIEEEMAQIHPQRSLGIFQDKTLNLNGEGYEIPFHSIQERLNKAQSKADAVDAAEFEKLNRKITALTDYRKGLKPVVLRLGKQTPPSNALELMGDEDLLEMRRLAKVLITRIDDNYLAHQIKHNTGDTKATSTVRRMSDDEKRAQKSLMKLKASLQLLVFSIQRALLGREAAWKRYTSKHRVLG